MTSSSRGCANTTSPPRRQPRAASPSRGALCQQTKGVAVESFKTFAALAAHIQQQDVAAAEALRKEHAEAEEKGEPALKGVGMLFSAHGTPVRHRWK